jgi:hypothetical protein
MLAKHLNSILLLHVVVKQNAKQKTGTITK